VQRTRRVRHGDEVSMTYPGTVTPSAILVDKRGSVPDMLVKRSAVTWRRSTAKLSEKASNGA